MLIPPIVPPNGAQKPKATQINIKLPKLSVALASIATILIFAYVLYFVRPVLSLRFLGWIVPFKIGRASCRERV